MRRWLLPSALALAGALVIGGTSLGGSSDPGDGNPNIIRLTAVNTSFVPVSATGTQGPNPGNYVVVADDLLDREGRKVGFDLLQCTIVAAGSGGPPRTQCVSTFSLPQGQITAQAATTTPQPRVFQLAVTGGTGRYSDARGSVRVEQISESRARITFRLID